MKLLACLTMLSTVVVAQNLETRGNGSTGLHAEAGGPSMLGNGTRASDMSVAYDEVDFTINTALGPFALKRKFSSTGAWDSLATYTQFFGPTSANGGINWFSSLGTYAVYTFVPATGTPGNLVDPKQYIQARDAEGDLSTSVDIYPRFTTSTKSLAPVTGSSTSRLMYSGNQTVTPTGCNNSVSVPTKIFLTRPGEGKVEFEYRNATGANWQNANCNGKAWYRPKKIWADAYVSIPMCTFAYTGTAPFTSLACAGGITVTPTWNGTLLQTLSVSSAGDAPRVFASYAYDTASHLAQATLDGPTNSYAYSVGGAPGFQVSTGGTAASRVLLQRVLAGPQLTCLGNLGWSGPPSATGDLSPLQRWTVSQQQTCGGTKSSFAYEAQANGDTMQMSAVTESSAGLTLGLSRTCLIPGGAACPDIWPTASNWVLANNVPQSANLNSQNMRGAFTVNTLQANYHPDATFPTISTTQLDSQLQGAIDAQGTGALKTVNLTWQYWDAQGTHEQLPLTEAAAKRQLFLPRGDNYFSPSG